MVNINRNKLPEKDIAALLTQFDTIFCSLKQSGVQTIFSELFGHEERVMFAKRLAAIILLNEGASEYKTAQVLKLSPTTTGKISLELERGTYTGTIKLLRKNKKNYIDILNTIDSILHLGGALPHYCGLERYRNI